MAIGSTPAISKVWLAGRRPGGGSRSRATPTGTPRFRPLAVIRKSPFATGLWPTISTCSSAAPSLPVAGTIGDSRDLPQRRPRPPKGTERPPERLESLHLCGRFQHGADLLREGACLLRCR